MDALKQLEMELETQLKNELYNAILEDEKEYCFDVEYCDGELWKETHGDETREEAFEKVKKQWETFSLHKVVEHSGDQYEYIFNKYGLSTNDF